MHCQDYVEESLNPACEIRNFTSRDGVKLSYISCRLPGSRQTIVVSPGWSEPALKYSELIDECVERRVSVYVIDHRGQGFSEKQSSTPELGHIQDFDDYYGDFCKWIVAEIASQDAAVDRVLLGHSMGALIGLDFLAHEQSFFSRAVITSPMIQVRAGNLPIWLAKIVVRVATNLGFGEYFLPGQSKPISEYLFENNPLTSNLARWSRGIDIMIRCPETTVRGASFGWLNEALNACERIQSIPRIVTPCVVILPTEDEFVSIDAAIRFCNHKLERQRVILMPDAKHEILMENDEIRDVALNQLFSSLRR